ncbi:Rrf2 family transcriptional regulator [Deinococcus sp. YIM 77859]|uniref:Rrf2 family transcriptional regulator n=1 Tax=Deinococcus sp. YIM 77859 TaxID=1540221 RepID=UPI000557FC68|nr:Rrf2 family transcriptional regulator [Deinococcus sp. YIM 77859]
MTERAHTGKLSTRTAMAVHLLTLVEAEPAAAHSSEWLAGSLGVHPVVVRQITSRLRAAGLVETRRGKAGLRLTRPAREITLLDVYRAVEAEDALLALHVRPNPSCPVGSRIQAALEDVFEDAQRAFERSLAAHSVADVTARVLSRAG